MVIVLAAMLVLFMPDTALCFGPAFHLKIGCELLNYLTLFSPVTQQILTEHPLDFLYGNISPDIIIGKRFMPYHSHCHNWDVANSLLDMTHTARQKSFAYGYMAHLASDVAAHNYFIPCQIVSTFKSRTLTHLYWETRLDNKVERDIWKITQKFKTQDFVEHEQLLEDTLAYNLFPFHLHKKIYKGYILFSSLRQWHSTLNIVKKMSRYQIAPEFIAEIFDLSVRSSLDMLLGRNENYLFKSDPMGRKTIATAQMIKNNLKTAEQVRPLDDETERFYVAHFIAKLKKAYFQPDDLAAIISEDA